MNATLGHAGVYLAFAFSLLGASSIIYGLARNKPTIAKQGHSYIWLIGFGVLLAVFAMERGLITHDFHLQFVADNNSRETPLLFTISGMWAALEGSILLWGLVLVAYIATMSFHFRKRRDDAMVAWATAITFIVAAFFFALMAGPADPFKTLAAGSVPLDGSGPNPLLQDHVLMAFHPPILYSGYVGFTIPFAFGMAALITGRVGEGWLVETRRWTLVSWGFLSAGILLGSWWSYEVLGWGGYWAWDPVENASLLPWLTATAYLHSVIVQERRGMLRIWNLSLLGATFSLTILGTFFTRSGVLDSVHAFTQSPLGPWLIGAFTVVVAATCGLIFWRGDRLGSPGSIASPLSREGAFLANNVLFAAFAFVVLLGTVFPLLTEAVNNNRISVGAPYFNSMVRPIGLLLLLLMAFAPVLQWRGTPLELIKERALRAFAFMVLVEVICVAAGVRGLWVLTGIGLGAFVAATSLRQLELSVRRRGLAGFFGRSNGGMVAHLGIAIIALGVVASQSYAHRAEFEMKDGQTVTVAGHTVQFVGLATIPHGNRTSQVAAVKIDNGKVYEPALSRFPNSTDAIGTPTVKSSFTNDVYVTLVRTPSATDANTVISVIVTPLVSWIWGGGVVIAVGTVLALIPTAPTNGRRGILDLVAAESKQGGKQKGNGHLMSATVTDQSPVARSRRARWIALVAFLAVAVLIIVLATRPSADSKTASNPLVGGTAPTIKGTALDGRSVDLASLQGRWVVVNFFATWCVPCRQENPELKKFSAEHQGVDSPAIVAVAYDKNDLDSSKSFFAQNGNDWPAVPDDGGRTAISYGVRGLPESFIVNPQGKIAAQVTGGVTAAELDNLTGQVS